MKTEPKDKLAKLFALARESEPYRQEMEVGFETRLMANIRARREREIPFFVWTWRLMPVFVSLVILLGAWIYTFENRDGIDLSAVTKINSEETMLTAFLTGE